MEHINETEAPADAAPIIGGFDVSNGFYNTYRYITQGTTGNQWSAHANMTEPNEKGYTFALSKKHGWSACLSRNRDENHNGIIDPEELNGICLPEIN